MGKYLVTGANGFVGSNLVRVLLKEGHEVRGMVRKNSNIDNIAGLPIETVIGDIRDEEALNAPVRGVDGVFHTAALYRFWAPQNDLFYDTNVVGTRNVLNASDRADVERVVVTSTASLLAHSEDGESLPRSTDGLPSAYKVTKYIAERESLSFNDERNLDVIIASPTVPIGPGDYGPTPTGRLILEYLNGRMKAYLDMNFNVVYVKDVAHGHLLAMEEGRPGKRYVLGNKNTSLSEIIDILANITGRDKPRFEIPYPVAVSFAWLDEFFEGFLLRKRPTAPISAIESTRIDERIDSTPWAKELGLPQTPIIKALKKAMDWYSENGYLRNGTAELR
ncbi:MAG: NAD-dependent epimerase/dehydratase family protein [Candidatus Bipolaricaulota bacterium]